MKFILEGLLSDRPIIGIVVVVLLLGGTVRWDKSSEFEILTTHPIMGRLVGWEEIGTCRPDA